MISQNKPVQVLIHPREGLENPLTVFIWQEQKYLYLGDTGMWIESLQ